jgi:hypothetical protein
MKKLILALAIIALQSGFTYAQLVVGVELGRGYILNEDTKTWKDGGYDVSKSCYPVLLEGAYKLPNSIDVPSLGSTTIMAGLKLGFMNGTKATKSSALGSFKYHWNTVPIYLFARGESGFLFSDIGFGLHLWSMQFDANTGVPQVDNLMNFEDNGFDLSLYFKSGVKYDITNNITVRGGLSINTFGFDRQSNSVGNDSGIITFGLFAGATYNL